MIRLQFKDKFCDSLDDLKLFLGDLAQKQEEKNIYHISVADKFRKGLLVKWLTQERAFLSQDVDSDNIREIDALIDAVQEVSEKLEGDAEIFNWLARVFCNQSRTAVTVNPYRYIEPGECVVRFDKGTGEVVGYFNYHVVQEAREVFHVFVQMGPWKTELFTFQAGGARNMNQCIPFRVQCTMSVSEETILSVRVIIDETPIPDAHVLVETNIPGVFLRAQNRRIRICYERDHVIYEKVSSVTQLMQQMLAVITVAKKITSILQSGSEGEELPSLYSQAHLLMNEGFSWVEPFNVRGVTKALGNSVLKECFLYKDGRIIPYWAYDGAWLVGNGKAAVKLPDGRVDFIDSCGNLIYSCIHPKIVDMRTFSEGYLAILRDTGEWGYLAEADGQIFGSYSKAGDFKNGRAIVKQIDFNGVERWKEVDRDFNETVISPQSVWIDPPPSPTVQSGMQIKEHEGKWSLSDVEDGRPIPVLHLLSEWKENKLFEFDRYLAR